MSADEGRGDLLEGYRPHPQVVARRLGDSGVVIDLRTGRIFELNETGFRIWELAAEGRAVADIEHQLLAEFSATQAQVKSELVEVLNTFLREGLFDVEPRG